MFLFKPMRRNTIEQTKMLTIPGRTDDWYDFRCLSWCCCTIHRVPTGLL